MTERPGTAKSNAMIPLLVAIAAIVVIALAMFLRRGASEPQAAAVVAEPATAGEPVARRGRSSAGARYPGQPVSAEVVREQRQRTAEKRQQVQQEVDRTQAAFSSRYANERVDTAWAGAKESELTRLAVSDQIRQLGVEAENLVVDCKSTMCRITGDFKTMSAGDDWITLYMNNVGEAVPTASYKYITKPDGTVTINVYAVGRK